MDRGIGQESAHQHQRMDSLSLRPYECDLSRRLGSGQYLRIRPIHVLFFFSTPVKSIEIFPTGNLKVGLQLRLRWSRRFHPHHRRFWFGRPRWYGICICRSTFFRSWSWALIKSYFYFELNYQQMTTTTETCPLLNNKSRRLAFAWRPCSTVSLAVKRLPPTSLKLCANWQIWNCDSMKFITII